MARQELALGGATEALAANKDIRQLVEVLPSAGARDGALIAHINTMPAGCKVLIFCSTKKSCDALSAAMARQIGCASIHGDKDQREREAVRPHQGRCLWGGAPQEVFCVRVPGCPRKERGLRVFTPDGCAVRRWQRRVGRWRA